MHPLTQMAAWAFVFGPIAATAQVPYPNAGPWDVPSAGDPYGVPPAPSDFYPGYGGPLPGSGAYGPPPSAYVHGPYGPAPPGALDLDAPPFGAATGPRIEDPAFGPAPARRPAPMEPMRPQHPFSPDIPAHRSRSVRDYARTAIDAPEPQEIKLHDIVTILVDEKAELLVQSRFNRQRNATFKAELKEFMRIDDDFNLASAATDGPTIDANLRARLQSDGSTTDREGIRYRIAATVVGVLPNGNVVLEARKTIRSNDGLWEYTLTGTIASRDIKRDYTAVSENVANLQIEKTQKGKIADSTQRPWGMWLYDRLSPF